MKTCFGRLKVYGKCHEFNVLFHITGFYLIMVLTTGGFFLQNDIEPIMPNSNWAPEISRNIMTWEYLFGLEMYFSTE